MAYPKLQQSVPFPQPMNSEARKMLSEDVVNIAQGAALILGAAPEHLKDETDLRSMAGGLATVLAVALEL